MHRATQVHRSKRSNRGGSAPWGARFARVLQGLRRDKNGKLFQPILTLFSPSAMLYVTFIFQRYPQWNGIPLLKCTLQYLQEYPLLHLVLPYQFRKIAYRSLGLYCSIRAVFVLVCTGCVHVWSASLIFCILLFFSLSQSIYFELLQSFATLLFSLVNIFLVLWDSSWWREMAMCRLQFEHYMFCCVLVVRILNPSFAMHVWKKIKKYIDHLEICRL